MKTDVLKIGSKALVKKKVTKDENEYSSQIQNIDGNKITILTPLYKSILINLHEGTRIELLVFSDEKVYELDAQVLETRKEGNIYYTDIEAIGNVKKIERRYYFRVKTMKDILLREKDEKNPKEYSHGLTIDLSGGGLQLSSTADFEENSIIEIKIDIDDEEFNIEGEILSKFKQEGLGSYKYTVRFLNLDNAMQESVVRYVFKLQRESLKKNI